MRPAFRVRTRSSAAFDRITCCPRPHSYARGGARGRRFQQQRGERIRCQPAWILFESSRRTWTRSSAEHPAHDIGAAGEQEAQRKRNTQHRLAHRLFRKHLVDRQRRALDHAPRTAARAEAAAFTAERDQVLGMTGAAANSKKTVLEARVFEH